MLPCDTFPLYLHFFCGFVTLHPLKRHFELAIFETVVQKIFTRTNYFRFTSTASTDLQDITRRNSRRFELGSHAGSVVQVMPHLGDVIVHEVGRLGGGVGSGADLRQIVARCERPTTRRALSAVKTRHLDKCRRRPCVLFSRLTLKPADSSGVATGTTTHPTIRPISHFSNL